MSAFQGRHVVVTGGFGGLGIPVVEGLLDVGAEVHVPDRRGEVPDVLAGRPGVHVISGIDLSDEGSVASVYRSLPGLWASLHVAGGFSMAPVVDTSVTEFERMFAMNTVTCFLCSREAVRAIRKSGEGGRIVNVAARPALEPCGGMIAYSVSKAAVASLTQSLAIEVAPDGILVNAIAPSIIDTPANREAMPDADYDKWPKPAELAKTMRYLASPENDVTTGAIVPVYGRA